VDRDDGGETKHFLTPSIVVDGSCLNLLVLDANYYVKTTFIGRVISNQLGSRVGKGLLVVLCCIGRHSLRRLCRPGPWLR
jgi:hypothetical protein